MNTVIGKDIHAAAELLRKGELVAIPTETVYGLAANAFDPEAVLKIFQVKQRPAFDPLIVHIGKKEDLDRIASSFPPSAEALIGKFWPGPLTLVLPKHPEIPDIVTSGLDTVGVRMPAHPIALELLQHLDFPLAAPSANPFGYISPTTARHVSDQLGERIPYILDGGAATIGVESTILGLEDGKWMCYRVGGIPLEAIEEVIGKVERRSDPASPVAPGMLTSHYAPRKPLLIGDVRKLIAEHPGKPIGVIAFRDRFPSTCCHTLSPAGDLSQAARKLFSALRELDNSDVELIVAEIFPAKGLGNAINDRLLRASASR